MDNCDILARLILVSISSMFPRDSELVETMVAKGQLVTISNH